MRADKKAKESIKNDPLFIPHQYGPEEGWTIHLNYKKLAHNVNTQLYKYCVKEDIYLHWGRKIHINFHRCNQSDFGYCDKNINGD